MADQDGSYTDPDDQSLGALDCDENEDNDYEDHVDGIENEQLEQEYLRYLKRQGSLPDCYQREHGASF